MSPPRILRKLEPLELSEPTGFEDFNGANRVELLEPLERLEPTRSNDLNGAQRLNVLNDLNQVDFRRLEPLNRWNFWNQFGSDG